MRVLHESRSDVNSNRDREIQWKLTKQEAEDVERNQQLLSAFVQPAVVV